MNSALIKWLYLPDFFRAPNSTNLISESPPPWPAPRGAHTRGKPVAQTDVCLPSHTGDFLLLLCASQQWQVFLAERTEEWQRMAGANTDHLELPRGEANPVPNFIHCRYVPGPGHPGPPVGAAHPQCCLSTPGPTWTC